MSKEINFNSIEEFMQELNKKTKEDTEFKKLCLESPREATVKITALKIPESMQFSFIESCGELVLKMDDEGEISDDELDNVEGGGLLCDNDVGRFPPRNPNSPKPVDPCNENRNK